ncbi:MAG: SDR family NAD(P)-dependent oxidoreductase [Clostridia bacterium]
MSKKDWLYGRNVVLTGCSTGIGKEVLLLLVNKYGCNVMGIARNQQKLDALKSELPAGKFDYRRFNISSSAEWKAFAQELDDIGFATDILINNAGMIQPFSQYTDLSSSQIEKVVDTNLMSIIYSCEAMLPAIKKSIFGGLVNVSSASAILPVAGESIYSATKGGVWALSETLSQELRGFGIYVGCVMPGPVKTDLYKPREGEAPKADSFIENIGMTAAKAGQKIVKAMRKRKTRVIIDAVAGLMDFGMRLCPSITGKLTSKLMKAVAPKVSSFYPIFKEQYDRKEELESNKKLRKEQMAHSLEDIKKEGFFK